MSGMFNYCFNFFVKQICGRVILYCRLLEILKTLKLLIFCEGYKGLDPYRSEVLCDKNAIEKLESMDTGSSL